MDKHLEFAQGIINRMSQNSFLIKGWTITLVAALIALAGPNMKQSFIVLAYFPTFMFWVLDSYYLYQERLFRDVYNHVRTLTPPTDFSLSTANFDEGFPMWCNAAFSKTILLFYGLIFFTLIVIMFFIK